MDTYVECIKSIFHFQGVDSTDRWRWPPETVATIPPRESKMWSKKSLLRKHRSAPLRLDHPNGFTKLQTASLSSNEVGGFFFGIREQIFFLAPSRWRRVRLIWSQVGATCRLHIDNWVEWKFRFAANEVEKNGLKCSKQCDLTSEIWKRPKM
jgi:hypothetical protein